MANLCWVFLLGLAPFFVVSLCFSRRNANLAGGFAGRFGLVFVCRVFGLH